MASAGTIILLLPLSWLCLSGLSLSWTPPGVGNKRKHYKWLSELLVLIPRPSTFCCVFLWKPVEQAALQSSQVPLIFGDFTGLTMADGAPLSVEIVATQATANQSKVNEQISGVNDAMSLICQKVAELTASVADIAGAIACKNPGPTDHEGVARALRNPAARQKAIKEYGIAWLIDAKDKQLWPASALHDDDFLIQYVTP